MLYDEINRTSKTRGSIQEATSLLLYEIELQIFTQILQYYIKLLSSGKMNGIQHVADRGRSILLD